MIRFACPRCSVVYTAPDRAVGKKTTCRSCQQRLQVPTPSLNHTVLGKLLPSPQSTSPAPMAIPVGVPATVPVALTSPQPTAGTSPLPLPPSNPPAAIPLGSARKPHRVGALVK